MCPPANMLVSRVAWIAYALPSLPMCFRIAKFRQLTYSLYCPCTALAHALYRPCTAVVPAGYYLKAPGQVAPCPRGEWKSGVGPSGNCTKCAFGVTTKNEASTAESECKGEWLVCLHCSFGVSGQRFTWRGYGCRGFWAIPYVTCACTAL